MTEEEKINEVSREKALFDTGLMMKALIETAKRGSMLNEHLDSHAQNLLYILKGMNNIPNNAIKELVERACKYREKIENKKEKEHLETIDECFFGNAGLFGFVYYLCTIILRIIDGQKEIGSIMIQFLKETGSFFLEIFPYGDLMSDLIETYFESDSDLMKVQGLILKNDKYTTKEKKNIWKLLRSARDTMPCYICESKVAFLWPVIYDLAYEPEDSKSYFPRRHCIISQKDSESKYCKMVTLCSIKCLNKSKSTEAALPNLQDIMKHYITQKNPTQLITKNNLVEEFGFQPESEFILSDVIMYKCQTPPWSHSDVVKNERCMLSFYATELAKKEEIKDIILASEKYFLESLEFLNRSDLMVCFLLERGSHHVDKLLPLRKTKVDMMIIHLEEISKRFIACKLNFEDKTKVLELIDKSDVGVKIRDYVEKIKNKIKELKMKDIEYGFVMNEDIKNDEKEKEESSARSSKQCKKCQKSEGEVDLLRCNGCLKTRYCSQECQNADWERHKDFCVRKQKKRKDKNKEKVKTEA